MFIIFFQGPFDKKHQIKCAIGNGLRADIWQEFKDRFEISNIYEFYAATEGNAAFINLDNLVGSCGRCTPFQVLRKRTFILPNLKSSYNISTFTGPADMKNYCL